MVTVVFLVLVGYAALLVVVLGLCRAAKNAEAAFHGRPRDERRIPAR